MITALIYVIEVLVFLAIPCMVILIAEQAVRAVQALLAWRACALIEKIPAELGLNDQPVPYWPSEEPDEKTISTLLFCPACHPGGHGTCTCVAYCGDRQCTFGYTARLSAEEAAWLRVNGIKEGTDQ